MALVFICCVSIIPGSSADAIWLKQTVQRFTVDCLCNERHVCQIRWLSRRVLRMMPSIEQVRPAIRAG
jgi:hypothetical protein